MSLKHYGVLRGRVVAAKREDDASTPHYQVQVRAAGVDYRLAVNVKSQLSPSELLFLVDENFRHPVIDKLFSLEEGFTPLPGGPGRLRSTSSAATSSTASICASCRPVCPGRITI